MIIERRIMAARAIKKMCIENNYFNNGSKSDYNGMFNYIGALDYVTVKEIKKVANMIIKHTIREDDELVLELVMGAIAKTLHVFYVKE